MYKKIRLLRLNEGVRLSRLENNANQLEFHESKGDKMKSQQQGSHSRRNDWIRTNISLVRLIANN